MYNLCIHTVRMCVGGGDGAAVTHTLCLAARLLFLIANGLSHLTSRHTHKRTSCMLFTQEKKHEYRTGVSGIQHANNSVSVAIFVQISARNWIYLSILYSVFPITV